MVFLRYFVAAIRTVFPESCIDTLALLQAPQPVAQAPLVVALSNEIEQLPARCVLVLDDYHAIHGAAVHDFLSELLRHWPQRLHLVLISRNSPPLPLANLRATGQVCRNSHARFAFHTGGIGRVPGQGVGGAPQPTCGDLARPAHRGLGRRAAPGDPVAARAADAETELASLSVGNVEIADYLMDQVISHQPPAILKFLLATSILDRFCAPLCECVLRHRQQRWSPVRRTPRALSGWSAPDLFVIPLDNDRQWYRYHHLFQDLLQRRLLAEVGPEQVAELHRAAAAWFAGQGLIDEALHHALAIDNLDLAARLMQAGLCDVLNREDRATLERWLRLLPEDFIERRPWLLMIKALALQFSSQLPAVWKLLGQIEALIDEGGAAALHAGDADDLRVLRGLVAALRSQEAFSNGQAAQRHRLLRGGVCTAA